MAKDSSIYNVERISGDTGGDSLLTRKLQQTAGLWTVGKQNSYPICSYVRMDIEFIGKRIEMDQKETTTENVHQFLTSIGYIAIPFRQNVAGQLLLNAKINDVDGVYILDSGAGQTVVDAQQLDTLKLKVNYDEAALTGGGVGAHGIENIPSYNNKIEINNFKLDKLVVAVMSLETAWESLERVGAHDTLFGIIGVDILKTGKAIVDFSTMTLYLVQP